MGHRGCTSGLNGQERHTDGSVSIAWKKATYLSLFLGFQTVRAGTVGTLWVPSLFPVLTELTWAFMSTRWRKEPRNPTEIFPPKKEPSKDIKVIFLPTTLLAQLN